MQSGETDQSWPRFESGWPAARKPVTGRPQYPNRYWVASSGAWKDLEPGHYQFEDPRLDTIELNPYLSQARQVFDSMMKQWEVIKSQHPSAIWDPREGRWLIPTERKPPNGKDPDTLLRAALAECDRKRDAGLFRADEYQRCRDEAFRLHGQPS